MNFDSFGYAVPSYDSRLEPDDEVEVEASGNAKLDLRFRIYKSWMKRDFNFEDVDAHVRESLSELIVEINEGLPYGCRVWLDEDVDVEIDDVDIYQ